MRTIPDGTEESNGLGKPIRPEPKPPEDVVIEVKPGVWSVNGKLQTNKPQKPIDWEAINDALEVWAQSHEVDIIVLEDGILSIARDPMFPRDEFGSL